MTYITLDGMDCVGKSTLSHFLSDHFSSKGKKVLLTKEPGSKEEVCIQIRKLLLDPKYLIESDAGYLLFMADRAQHIRSLVLPHLQEGYVVISDRSFITGLVYHWAEDKTVTGDKIAVCNLAQAGLRADKAFIVTADFEQSQEMLEAKVKDRIELKGTEYRKKLHSYFQAVNETTWQGLSCWPKEIINFTVDFSKPIEQNCKTLLKYL